VNPRHLRWATHRENEADKVRHGTLRKGEAVHAAKLSAAEVAEIRTIYAAGGVTQSDLATRFGTSPGNVSRIIRNAEWRDDTYVPPATWPNAAKCGTRYGAKRHRRNGEVVCESCLEAEREYTRERRAIRCRRVS